MRETEQARRHVLVVEDDADNAALLADVLEGRGYAVTIAYDGEDALDEIRRRRPDLVTLDIQMPRMTGTLFYRRMKTDRTLRDVPVIVVTGLTRDDANMELLIRSLLEVDHLPAPEAYLEKPVDGRTLLETAARLLPPS